MGKVLRITSAHPGFIRGGHPHPATPTDYALDFFNEEQLVALRAEPMLTVEEVDADEAASVVERQSPPSAITEQQFNEFVERMTADHQSRLADAVAEALAKAGAEKDAAIAEALNKASAEKDAALDELRKQAEIDKEAAVAQAFEMAAAEKDAAVAEALKATDEKETGGKAKPAASKK